MHDHAEIELAAAAIDFELTPEERGRLERAVAACSVCAAAAAGYRRQATLLTELPVLDASPSVRVAVERAAGLRRQRSSSWSWVLLAAALLGLLLTSALVVGAINQLERGRIAEVSPSPTPTPAPSSVPSPMVPEPSPDVIALDPPSGDLADVGPPIASGSSALVVTDHLRIRSAPFVGSASLKYRDMLQPDDRLYVIDGPVIGQNYEWYQVAAWRPSDPTTRWPVGWVARAGHNGEIWFKAAAASCPSAPLSIEALLALAPADRIACFHDTPIDIRAVVGSASIDCDPSSTGCPTGPAWLATSTLRAAISSAVDGAVASMPIALDPAASLDPKTLLAAGVVQLHGTFDRAEARQCAPDASRPGPDGPLAPVDATLACRLRFVVTAVTPETFPSMTQATAKTVSPRLRVRSLPETSDASTRYEPLLPLGTKLVVLDGPTLGDGYAWYHVVATIVDAHGAVTQTLTGWVAAAGLDGERWITSTGPSGSAP